jgi:hypothetical protein
MAHPSFRANTAGALEEHPHLPSIAQARSFQISVHAYPLTSHDEGKRILSPAFLIKIGGQQPAGFVSKEWIDADRFLAGQV